MNITSGSKVHHECIQESIEGEMKDLVGSTQKTLADWKIKTKRKRFRFQNFQGMILALCHFLMISSWSLQGWYQALNKALKTITVERINLSLGLTKLFCQNSDYDTLKLIQDGINLDKKAAIKILEVFCASQTWKLLWTLL